MLKQIMNWLLNRGSPSSIDTRLNSIEERLDRIERLVRRQTQLGAIAFVYAAGLALIAIGWAIRDDYPCSASALMP